MRFGAEKISRLTWHNNPWSRDHYIIMAHVIPFTELCLLAPNVLTELQGAHAD